MEVNPFNQLGYRELVKKGWGLEKSPILRNMAISSGNFSGAHLTFAKKGFFQLLLILLKTAASGGLKPQYTESTLNLLQKGI